jgi:ABC-2 type transport system permease protein
VDRLIAIVLLRFRLELRAMLHARERRLGLVLAVPFLLLFSAFGSMIAFAAVRSVGQADPGVLAALLSAVATALGVFWILSPLLTGFALAETHDLTRLVHFPVPLPTLALSSLIANLAQPTVLAEVPIAFAIALALSHGGAFPLAVAGVLSTLLFYLAASQAAGLVLHALTRNRRLHDAALFVALGLGFSLSLLPMLILTGGLRPLAGGVARAALRADVFAWSPFAWGARAAVHGGRGELVPFAAWLALQWLAIAAAVLVSTALIRRIYHGEVKLGIAAGRAAARARMWLPGATGALVEKDLRVAWRNPALKATLFMGLATPLVFFVIVSQTGTFGRSGTGLLALATYIGMATFGSNAFGMERRGVALLLGFPIARWRMLVGKNLSGMFFRLPALVALVIAGALLSPPYLPAAIVIALCAMLVAAGADNFISILFPVTAPEPGRSPHAAASAGGRGLASALLSAALFTGAMMLAAPFIALAWLPHAFARLHWWWVSLPLALAGAAATYALLVGGAEQLLLRREPELLERILGEA